MSTFGRSPLYSTSWHCAIYRRRSRSSRQRWTPMDTFERLLTSLEQLQADLHRPLATSAPAPTFKTWRINSVPSSSPQKEKSFATSTLNNPMQEPLGPSIGSYFAIVGISMLVSLAICILLLLVMDFQHLDGRGILRTIGTSLTASLCGSGVTATLLSVLVTARTT